MKIISVREHPNYKDIAIQYISSKWPDIPVEIYQDCISHSIETVEPLPQWYLLEKQNTLIGCVGLITNDFISRMDLYPWLCALYIDTSFRGNGYSQLLINKVKQETLAIGFEKLYLCTDLIGFYEKYQFQHIGLGYHPWGEQSPIYCCKLT